MTIDLTVGAAFLLVLARTTAWVMAAPFFSARGISPVGRLALSLALSAFLAPLAAEAITIPDDPVRFGGMALGQVFVGLALGWATGLLFHAFEAAGTMMDISSGFSIGAVLDPMSGNQASVFARFTNVLLMTLLVVTNAHLTLVAGFVRSFEAVPADTFPGLGVANIGMLAHAVTGLLVAALEIGAPVLGALFLTEVALAVAARFAPQANVFAIGLPLKVLVSLAVVGAALVFLPSHVAGIVDKSLRLGDAVL